MKKIFALILLLLLPTTLLAQTKPLPIDQAFSLSAQARDNQTVLAVWTIAPGYYLYRDRIHFSAVHPQQDRLAQPLFPSTSLSKHYPSIGKLAVYEDILTIPIPIIQNQHANIAITAHYQGCSKDGFCYPPTSRVIQLNLSGPYGMATPAMRIDLPPARTTNKILANTSQDRIVHLLESANLLAILAGFWFFGFLISLTPCVLPMIPILSSIIVGQEKISHARSFGLSLAYVLGMALTYAVAGILFSIIGGNVQAALQKPWIIVLFSLLFVAMAFSLFGLFNLQLPEALRSRIATLSNHQKRGSYLGVAIMGVLSTLLLSPCVTPPLVGILSYISQTGNSFLGGATLFVMGLGMGTPLLVIGASSAKLLPKAGAWMNAIKTLLGVLMLALAIWILERLLAPETIMALWAILAMSCAIALGALSSAQTFSHLLKKSLGLLLFVYGILLLVGIYFDNTNPLAPLYFPRIQNTSLSETQPLFTPIKTKADLKEKLTLAKKSHKIVVLDFYADWCIACKEMDHLTFSDAAVRHALQNEIALRADVTKNDSFDQALQKAYGVVAPPTLLFFYNGHEIKNSRIVGEVSAKEFLQRLEKLSSSHAP